MQLLHGSPAGLMQGHYFRHMLHVTEETEGSRPAPLRLLETGQGGTRRVLEVVKEECERDEVLHAGPVTTVSRHPGCLCRSGGTAAGAAASSCRLADPLGTRGQ